jgi:hypothetical protein
MTYPEQAQSFTKPERRTYYVADLKCYMCGSVAGSIESERPFGSIPPQGGLMSLRQTGSERAIQIANWRKLRCDRCGGPLFLDEADTVTRRYEEYNWLEERPRRGRPPKRLIEERRRERELLESQAA